eukprot:g3990.t1
MPEPDRSASSNPSVRPGHRAGGENATGAHLERPVDLERPAAAGSDAEGVAENYSDELYSASTDEEVMVYLNHLAEQMTRHKHHSTSRRASASFLGRELKRRRKGTLALSPAGSASSSSPLRRSRHAGSINSENMVSGGGGAAGDDADAENKATNRAEAVTTFDALPDETIAEVLSFARPWASSFFLVSKRFLSVMKEQNAFVYIVPPRLPCSVHLECDVFKERQGGNNRIDRTNAENGNPNPDGGNGNNNGNTSPNSIQQARLMRRCIYNLRQLLWNMPLSFQRFEWAPGRFCRACEELSIPIADDYVVWKRILKHMQDRQEVDVGSTSQRSSTPGAGASRIKERSAEYPHYCEISDSGRTIRAYVSDAEAQALIRLAHEHQGNNPTSSSSAKGR